MYIIAPIVMDGAMKGWNKMEKCECWCKRAVKPKFDKMYSCPDIVQFCIGTKEQEICTCNGDTTKCNFYPEKRKESESMNTTEMWIKAQENGKTYKCYDMYYNKRFGFHDKNKKKWIPNAFDTVDEIFDLDAWKLKEENEMTKSEAEARFNIKIVGD